jgi:hypothetical protein
MYLFFHTHVLTTLSKKCKQVIADRYTLKNVQTTFDLFITSKKRYTLVNIIIPGETSISLYLTSRWGAETSYF